MCAKLNSKKDSSSETEKGTLFSVKQKSNLLSFQNSKVCTYCVKIQYDVTGNECTMIKPDTCERPKDIKNGSCACTEAKKLKISRKNLLERD